MPSSSPDQIEDENRTPAVTGAECQRITDELNVFLREVADAYVAERQLKGDRFVPRTTRRISIFAASFGLRRLIRQARLIAKRPARGSDVEALLEDVFQERRVLRSTVMLRPDYGALADAVDRIGRRICEGSTDRERLSVGAVMQVCSCAAENLIDLCRSDPIKSCLSEQHHLLLGIDALRTMDLLVPPGEPPFVPHEKQIAYVAGMTLPYVANGYSTRTEGVALAYTSIGLSVDVISKAGFPLNIPGKKPAEGVPQTQTHNGVFYHRILQPTMDDTGYTVYAEKAADQLEAKLRELKPSQVIAASNFENSLPALIAARRLGLPFTYEVRGMWELTRASRHSGFEHTRLFSVMQHLEGFVCRQADKVLTLTHAMQDNLVARGVAPEKIAIMPNGVSPDMLETVERDRVLSEKLNISSSDIVIGYAGAFKEFEGLQDLAAAVVKLVSKGLNVRLLVIGAEKSGASGRTPITDEIKTAFATIDRSHRLILTGRVPYEVMPRYYSLMDICPITRRAYAVSEMVSPIKPVEALAQGKAVILSDVQAMTFFAQNETTALIFRKGDVDHLAEVIERLVTNGDLRAALGARGQEFVKSRLQWSKICSDAATHMGLI